MTWETLAVNFELTYYCSSTVLEIGLHTRCGKYSHPICVLCLCVVCVEAATLKLKVYIARKYSIAGDDTPL